MSRILDLNLHTAINSLSPNYEGFCRNPLDPLKIKNVQKMDSIHIVKQEQHTIIRTYTK